MPIDRARTTIGQVFSQRCFYLFVALLALMTAALLVDLTPPGRLLLNAINLMIDVAAVAAVGRSFLSFVVASALAIPAMLFQIRGIVEESETQLVISWAFNAALYAVTIAYLLRYVFQREVMTADKLYGAAAGYLMIGVLWAMLYAIASHFQPEFVRNRGQHCVTRVHGLALLQHNHADEYRLWRHRAAAAERSRALRVRTADRGLVPGDLDCEARRRVPTAAATGAARPDGASGTTLHPPLARAEQTAALTNPRARRIGSMAERPIRCIDQRLAARIQ